MADLTALELWEEFGKPAFDSFTKSKQAVIKQFRPLEVLFQGGYQEYFKRCYEHYASFYALLDHERPRRLLDVYTPLSLVQAGAPGTTIEVKAYPKKLFQNDLQHLFVDSAGVGKTTLAKFIFLSAVESRERIPILVQLRDLAITDKVTLSQFIVNEVNTVGSKTLDVSSLADVLNTGQILLILDGLEELDDKSRGRVALEIESLLKLSPKCPLILTSRPDPVLTRFPALRAWTIERLSRKQAYDMIRKYEVDNKRADLLVSSIKRNPRIDVLESFLKVPLLVMLLIASFDHKQNIPLKRHIFFAQVYDALFDRHDNSKEGYTRSKNSGLAKDEFERVLRGMCFFLFKEGKYEFSESELKEALRKAGGAFPTLKFSQEAFLTDLKVTVPLLEKNGGVGLRFAHPSLQDYFSALCIERDIPQKERLLLDIYKNGRAEGASEMLRLYADIDPYTFKQCVLKDLAQKIVRDHAAFIANGEDSLKPSLSVVFSKTFFLKLIWVPNLFDEKHMVIRPQITAFRKYLKSDLKLKEYEQVLQLERFRFGAVLVVHTNEHGFFSALREEQPIEFLRRNTFAQTSKANGRTQLDSVALPLISVPNFSVENRIRSLSTEEIFDLVGDPNRAMKTWTYLSVDPMAADSFLRSADLEQRQHNEFLGYLDVSDKI
jgi:hypothetical protein